MLHIGVRGGEKVDGNNYYVATDSKTGEQFLAYEEKGYRTSWFYREIPKTEYLKMVVMNNDELRRYVEENYVTEEHHSYGFYGCKVTMDRNVNIYFLGLLLGNSCD